LKSANCAIRRRKTKNSQIDSLLSDFDLFVPNPANGGAEFIGRAEVLQNNICAAALFIHWPLCGLAVLELGLAPTAVKRSGEASSARGIDKDDDIAHGSPKRFEQEWRVEDNGGAACGGKFRTLFGQPLFDAGMEHTFQKAAVFNGEVACAGKNPGSNRFAVDVAVVVKDGAAPTRDEGIANFGIRRKDFVASAVGIEDTCTEVGELPRDE
jgi:hypothetical protein